MIVPQRKNLVWLQRRTTHVFYRTIKTMILLHMLTFLAKKRNFWWTFKSIGPQIQSVKEGMFFIMSRHIIMLNLLNKKEGTQVNYFRFSHLPFECPGKWTYNSTQRSLLFKSSPSCCPPQAVKYTPDCCRSSDGRCRGPELLC